MGHAGSIKRSALRRDRGITIRWMSAGLFFPLNELHRTSRIPRGMQKSLLRQTDTAGDGVRTLTYVNANGQSVDFAVSHSRAAKVG